MSFRKDVAANYVGAGITVLAPLLTLPWYLAILGTKNWGLVSFVVVMQGMLGIVNSGLAQALTREISQLSMDVKHGQKKIASLLFGFERIYWIFSVIVGIIVAFFSSYIVNDWLKLGQIPKEAAIMVINIAAVMFVVQFPVSIYRSVLIGSGRQIQQNTITSIATIIRHSGCLLILYPHGSVTTYLIWNCAAALIETLITARFSWKNLCINRSELYWDKMEMRKILPVTLSLSVSIILGVITLQIDKLVISRMLAIEQLGYYAIASTVSIGLLQLYTPVISAAMPRIVKLQDQQMLLRVLNMQLMSVMLGFVIVGGLGYVLVGHQILQYWLRDAGIVERVHPVLTVLLVGTALNALYSVGYVNWIAKGYSKKILIVNASALVLALAFLPVIISRYQLLGAAIGWIGINLIGLVCSLDWLTRGAVSKKRADQ